MVATTWDSANKSTGIILGFPAVTDGPIALSTAGGYQGVRSVGSKTTGKFHAEIPISVMTAGDFCVGIATSTQSLTNYLGQGAAVGYFNYASVYASAVRLANTPVGYVTGDIVQIELDADAATVQFRVGATGTWSGLYTIPGSAPYYLMFSSQNSGGIVGLNAGNSTFNGAMSVGYSAWNAAGDVWNHSDKSASISLFTPNSLSASAISATNPGVFATRKTTSPLTYWEVAVPALSSGFSIGIADLVWSPSNNNLLGSDNYGLGFRQDGTVKLNNVTLATIFTYAQTDTIRVAVRALERLIFFDKNGANNWNNTSADPTTGVGGISYVTANMGSAVPAMSATVTSPPQYGNGVFTSGSWAYSAPASFVSIDGVGAPPASKLGMKEVFNAQVNSGATYVSRWIGRNLGQYNNDPKTANRGIYNGVAQTSISGVASEATVPVSGRVLRMYDHANGHFLGEYRSDPSTGLYNIPAMGRTNVYIVGIDPGFPALVIDLLTPV